MFLILGLSMFLLYAYNNYMDMVYMANDIYRSCKNWFEQFMNCKFHTVELSHITLDDTKYVFYEYSYNKDNYIIIAKPDKFTKTPYDVDTILSAHNSKSTIIRTKDIILMADAKTTNNEEIDVLDVIHKLCGPIGDFYKGTPVELEPEVIKLYVEKNKGIKIKNLKLLSAIGEEINLI